MAKHFLVELPDWEDPRIDAGYIRSVLSASDANVVDVVEASGGELAAARAEIERLRAGEDLTPREEGVWSTPGQWIARWNSLTAGERLDLATLVLHAGQEASECSAADHKGRLEAAERWRRQVVLAAEEVW